MSIRSDLLKEGIIARLKEYDAYIDDELPDYILVMIANKKSMDQIREDLQLFLTNNTEPFIQWLESIIQDPSQLEEAIVDDLSDGTPCPSPPSPKKQRKRSHDNSSSKVTSQGQDDHEESPPPTQKIKLPPDPSEKRARHESKQWKTGEQDLRSLIRKRKGESYSEDEEDSEVTGGVSSVVQLAPKKDRPRRSGGTGRLLQKAISDINSVSSSSSSVGKKRKSIYGKKDTAAKSQEDDNLKEYVEPDEFQEEKSTKTHQQPAIQKEVPVKLQRSEVKKKSIKERLDRTPEPESTQDELTAAEVATLVAVRKVLPQKPLDLRHFLKTKHKSPTSEVTKTPATSTRFVVTLDTNKEDVAKVTSSTRDEDSGDIMGRVSGQATGSSMPEKCKFWPNCKNGDSCTYHHPSVPCRLFPKCKYGNKCHYVHPLCKYDGRCTNPTCHYLHSVVKQPSTIIQQNVLPFSSPFPSIPQLSFGDMSRRKSRSKYPTKSALTWSPAVGKSLSERKD